MEEHEASTTTPSPPSAIIPKRPGLAAFLSIFPGVGHVYCGLYRRALMFFAAFAGSIQMIDSAGSPIFGLSLVFFWTFGVVDAYRQATLINLGYAADLGMAEAPHRGKLGQEVLITGVVLFSLGFLEFLSRLGLWDWDLLAEHAYVLLMIVGAWLMASVVLRRRKASREELASAFSEP